ncbi:MAG: Smr/MutS family protein [Phenylobacterium sp.]|uniref:Smr/MutS family protein n=1 Tax=Phenylobacterium sp. TaxID=1871053 RepID=UPI002A35FB4D|nr:Smr/MutS family protein [Phenylobacterium sp.]MDX9998191.1 Smr/MutS family protein [Phenylobacterium sp.]
MKRPLKPEEMRLWGLVASTVHPLPGRTVPRPPPESEPEPPAPPPAARLTPGSKAPASAKPNPAPRRVGAEPIEPGRLARIARGRDPIGGRIDLHGLDQDRARAALEAFLFRAWEDGYRSVLVITGKGTLGDGVLRRRAPEWLADPRLSGIVAGISEAHRRHGGQGALYVALKRRPQER